VYTLIVRGCKTPDAFSRLDILGVLPPPPAWLTPLARPRSHAGGRALPRHQPLGAQQHGQRPLRPQRLARAAFRPRAHVCMPAQFLVNSQDDLALTYNDIAVLENMHAAFTFTILRQSDCDVLANLSPQDVRAARRRAARPPARPHVCVG
jgi:hypothetical protein